MKYAILKNGNWRIISNTSVLEINNKIICNPKHQMILDEGYIEFDSTIPTGYTTDGYEVVNGKLKYRLKEIELPLYPVGWVYPARKIRITISKQLCKGDYASFITAIYVENVPIIRTDNDLIVYFEELNISDGFSLVGTEIQHIDPRLTIESYGEFEVIDNIIVSI